MPTPVPAPLVAIACGGTGGHLFPGLAVAQALQERGCDLLLLISNKEVDQQAVKSAVGLEVLALPAVGFDRRQWGAFLRGFWQSYGVTRRRFRQRRPELILAMGGFTSAPPVLAAKRAGGLAFLHEANSIPGRANRWLAPFVDGAFVYFEPAAARLRQQRILAAGMPVRPQFQAQDPGACRLALGLDPQRPTLLVTGGSQGAHAVNELLVGLLPALRAAAPELQYIHLTGAADREAVQRAYGAHQARALVRSFLTEMEWALGAATVAVTRAGASCLAEMAALRVPAILIPFPAAADNHQYYNARAFAETGAARLLEQREASSDRLLAEIRGLLGNAEARARISTALARWDYPAAARTIGKTMLEGLPPARKPQAAAASARDGEPARTVAALRRRGEGGSAPAPTRAAEHSLTWI